MKSPSNLHRDATRLKFRNENQLCHPSRLVFRDEVKCNDVIEVERGCFMVLFVSRLPTISRKSTFSFSTGLSSTRTTSVLWSHRRLWSFRDPENECFPVSEIRSRGQYRYKCGCELKALHIIVSLCYWHRLARAVPSPIGKWGWINCGFGARRWHEFFFFGMNTLGRFQKIVLAILK